MNKNYRDHLVRRLKPYGINTDFSKKISLKECDNLSALISMLELKARSQESKALKRLCGLHHYDDRPRFIILVDLLDMALRCKKTLSHIEKKLNRVNILRHINTENEAENILSMIPKKRVNELVEYYFDQLSLIAISPMELSCYRSELNELSRIFSIDYYKKYDPNEWLEGQVSWFNDGSGEGVVRSKDGQDYYIHWTAIEPAPPLEAWCLFVDGPEKDKSLKPRQKVKFQVIDDEFARHVTSLITTETTE